MQQQQQKHQETLVKFISALSNLGNAEVNVGYQYIRLFDSRILVDPKPDLFVSSGGARISVQRYVVQQKATAMFELRKSPSASSFTKALQFWSPGV